jgi:hypothetical protein
VPFPEPVPGLVIRYGYLWAEEHARGQGLPVIMTLRARAATEPVRSTENLPNGGFSKTQITWYEPEFVEGIESLSKRFEELGHRDCKRLVIEIRDLALSLNHHLPLMPAKKRGRQ